MKPIKVTIVGISADLGLFGNTHCTPPHSLKLWWLLVRILLAGVLWLLANLIVHSAFFMPAKTRRQKMRELSHRIFGFLCCKENLHEQENGFLARIEQQFQRPVVLTNLCIIGQSMRMACKTRDRIPGQQDIVILHLGVMDFINKSPCATFRAYTRALLAEVGRKNPAAHIIFLGPPDQVLTLTTPLNHQKALPLPFAPTVGDLHRLQGFHRFLKLTANSTASEIDYAARLLDIYVRIMQRELLRAHRQGLIHSYSFGDCRKVDIYAAPDRPRFFGLDGIHISREGVAHAVAFLWPGISKELAQNKFCWNISDEAH